MSQFFKWIKLLNKETLFRFNLSTVNGSTVLIRIFLESEIYQLMRWLISQSLKGTDKKYIVQFDEYNTNTIEWNFVSQQIWDAEHWEHGKYIDNKSLDYISILVHLTIEMLKLSNRLIFRTVREYAKILKIYNGFLRLLFWKEMSKQMFVLNLQWFECTNKYLSCCCTNLFGISQERYRSFGRLNSSFLDSFSAFNYLLVLTFDLIVIIVVMIVGIIRRGGGCPRWSTTKKSLVIYVVFQWKEWIVRVTDVIMTRHLFIRFCNCLK